MDTKEKFIPPPPPPKDERPQLRRNAHAAHAYGLLRGAIAGFAMRFPENERKRIDAVIEEAEASWSKFIEHA